MRHALGWKAGALVILAGLTAVALGSCSPNLRAMYHNAAPLKIGVPALSPDGSIVAFSFNHKDYHGGREILALYNVPEDRLELLPQPERFWWSSPAFSPDGSKLAFRSICFVACGDGESGYQVGIFDFGLNTFRLVTHDTHYLRDAVDFSPDGKKVLYTAKENPQNPPDHYDKGGLYNGLRLVSLETGKDTSFLPSPSVQTRFLRLTQPSFAGPDRVVFVGVRPQLNEDLVRRSEARERYGHEFAYSYRYNEPVSFFFEKHNISTLSFKSTVSGSRFVFIARVKCEGRKFCYDIHLSENDKIRRLTRMESYMAGATISPSGNRIAFLEDVNRHTDWEIWLADTGGESLHKTPIRRLVQQLVDERIGAQRGGS